MNNTFKNNLNNKMEKFLFKINVSNEAYKSKEEATAALSARAAKKLGLHKMAWKEQSVTITQFIKLITAGHTFCGLFDLPDNDNKVWILSGQWWNYTYPVYHTGANKGCMKINFKRDDYYRGAQAIFVDIDKTAYTSHTKYIDKLKFKPTVAYYTFSDQPRDRRFRLVYILDKVYDELDIRAMALYITNSIERDTREKMEDKCGIRPSQYFNGAYHHFAIYKNTKAIYSITDFDIDWDTIATTIIDSAIDENTDCFESDDNNEDYHDEDNEDNNKDNNEDNDKPVKNNKNNILEAPKSSITDPLAMVDEQMVKDIIHMSYNQFMYNYGNDRQHYRVYFRTQYKWEENQKYRVLTPEDDYLKRTYHHHKIEDLNHRRTITYRRMCERILMKPDVSINELIYNGYYDIHNVIETDPYQEKGKDIPFEDRTKIADFLVRKAKLAFSQKQYLRDNFKNAIDYYSKHRPRIVLNDTIALDWRQELAVARTTETDNQIAEVYDLNLSVHDNWLAMKQMGITIGMNRIYQWARRYGIYTKIKSQTTKRKGTEERELRNQQLMGKYNLNLTEKQNSILLSISPSMSHLIKLKLISKSIS